MKKLLAIIVFGLVFSLPTVFGTAVYAQINPSDKSFDPLNNTCEAANGGGDAAAICAESETGTDRVSGDGSIIATAANILAVIAGIIAVVIIIVSGIRLMTSNGDSAKFASSRNSIIYTVVGLFVVLMSRTIVVFIISRIST